MNNVMKQLEDLKRGKESICVVGLGYVGLPLAVALTEKFKVIGFDVNINRINELKLFKDSTNEINSKDLKSIKNKLKLSFNSKDIKKSKTNPININYWIH